MKLINLILSVVVLSFSHPLLASTEDEDWVSYDSIISELSSSKTSASRPQASGDPFEMIKLHAGVGLATSYVFVSPTQSSRVYGFLRGFEANLGIDLFSNRWMAEGSFRSFGTEELRKGEEVSLKEFDLKLIYQNKLTQKLGFKFGTGLASRYLEYVYQTPESRIQEKHSTPSAILTSGLKAFVTPAISLGADIGYRWAMIDDTIDESAVDASLRLDARF